MRGIGKNGWNLRGQGKERSRIYRTKSTRRPRGVPIPRALRGNGRSLTVHNYLQQSGIFLKQNPGEAHLAIDELRDMAASNNANVFMSKVSRYVGNIAGINAYWNGVREELKAIITSVGAPTLFFTFSSADMHWSELHALFKADTDSDISDSTSQERRQNVINNPHVVDWFFTQRLESFVKHWLYDTLGAKWHWFRYEYQGRGSIHCHGTAKLNNDPGLCQLTQTALKGFFRSKV